jgi:hypothetical protein
MAPVTIETTAQNSYYSAGNIGWSARSLFAYRTAIQQLAGASLETFGNTTLQSRKAQSFTTVGAIDVNEIRIAILKDASPVDNVSLTIYSDTGANLPNASIQAADNVYNGANVSTTMSWVAFQFATPVALSASTKYWIVVQRSGAVDATNFYRIRSNNGSVYAGGGVSAFNSGAGTWGAESATDDFAFQILTETPSALYYVVQDTSGLKLRTYKSTDGSSWTEQGAANAPAVTNANYPYDACDTRSGPYLVTARMTATNTFGARVFDMSTDSWSTSDFGTTPAADVSNERSIRVSCDNRFTTAAPGGVWVTFSDTDDDADLSCRLATSAGGAWGTQVARVTTTSTEAALAAAVVLDKSPIGFDHLFYYNPAADSFPTRSLTVSSTQGTQPNLSTTAADVETEHASARMPARSIRSLPPSSTPAAQFRNVSAI